MNINYKEIAIYAGVVFVGCIGAMFAYSWYEKSNAKSAEVKLAE